MKTPKQYEKKSGKKQPAKVTSVALESYQHELITMKNLNISAIVRDAVERFLLENFPRELNALKKEAGLK